MHHGSDWSAGHIAEHSDGVKTVLFGIYGVIAFLATRNLNFETGFREAIYVMPWIGVYHGEMDVIQWTS